MMVHRQPVILFVLVLGLASTPVEAQDDSGLVFDLRIEAKSVSFDELARLVPALNAVDLPADFRISQLDTSGPLDNLVIEFAAGTPRSRIEGTLRADLTAPGRRVRGSVSAADVDLAGWLHRPALPSDLTAQAEFDLQFSQIDGETSVSGTYTVRAPRIAVAGYRASDVRTSGTIDDDRVTVDARATAYGAPLTAQGSVELPREDRPARFDVRGRVEQLDLRRLPPDIPAPDVASTLTANFHLSGTPERFDGGASLSRSALAGATLAPGTTVRFSRTGRGFEYSASGEVGGLNLQRIGEAFDIEALTPDRFDCEIAASFEVAGTGDQLDRATATLEGAQMFGGALPHAVVTLAESADGWQFSFDGRFDGLDPSAWIPGEPVVGELTGSADAQGQISNAGSAFSLADDLTLSGRVSLDRASIAGVPVTRGTVAGRLGDGAVRIDELDLSGPGLALQASGTLGLSAATPTDLTYHVTTPPLSALTSVLDVPLDGTIRVSGEMHGTEVLTVQGTASGTDVSYGGQRVREFTSRYDADVPRRDWSASRVTARTEANGVRLAGRDFATIAAETTYQARQLTFDAATTQGPLTMQAGGRLDWLPGRQHIQLERLELSPGTTSWSLLPGTTAIVDYTGDQVVVEHLQLTGGAGERLSVDGSIGAGGAPLEVQAANVDLAAFSPIVGDAGLAGRLEALAQVTGSLAEPEVQATFAITDGAFRDFEYQRIAGQLDTARQPATFDVRLQRDPDAWLQASGRIPENVLGRLGGSSGSAATDAIDITLRSSSIPLGFVDTFTDLVQNVEGRMQADVRIGGTVADPVFAGHVALEDVALTVPRLGTRYSILSTTVRLDSNAVVLDGFRVLDDDQHWLQAQGRLPFQRADVADVQLEVQSDGFEVIDNELADVELDSLLAVTGDVLRPRVTGTVRVTSGTLHVDRLFESARPTPAVPDRTAPTTGRVVVAAQGSEGAISPAAEPGDGQVDATVSAAEGSDGLLEGVPIALDVRVEFPALSVHGRDLRGPGSIPIGLGDVDLTAAGDVRLSKAADQGLAIAGEVEIVRGTYEFQGREFTVAEGSVVRFVGLEAVNPALDITATREVSSVEARVHVGGTLEAPTLDLSSQPPLDQADILSLIVFNRPANQLDAGAQISLTRRAAAMAASFVAGEITDALGGLLNLDLIDIEAGVTGDAIAPVITIQQQVGGLYVQVRQQLASQQPSEVVLEYRVTDWLRIQSAITDRRGATGGRLRRGEGSGIDVVFTPLKR